MTTAAPGGHWRGDASAPRSDALGGDVPEPAAQIVGAAVGQALRRLRADRQERPPQAQLVDDARLDLVPVAVPGDLLADLAGEDVRGVGVVKGLQMPERWLSSMRTVMWYPLGNPGSNLLSGSSRLTLPSAASCRGSVEVKDLVMLPMRKRTLVEMGAPVASSPTPLVMMTSCLPGLLTAKTTPGQSIFFMVAAMERSRRACPAAPTAGAPAAAGEATEEPAAHEAADDCVVPPDDPHAASAVSATRAAPSTSARYAPARTFNILVTAAPSSIPQREYRPSEDAS